MVIIREHKKNGKKFYELEDLFTGQQMEWTAPAGIRGGNHREALIQVAMRFEALVLQDQERFKVSETPLSVEADENTLFGIYATKYFVPRRMPKISEKTREGWELYLRLRILPFLGDKPIGSITPGQLMDFFSGLQKEGLACQTVTRYFTLIRSIFKMAKRTGVIENNPMLQVDKPEPRKDELLDIGVEACTEEEVAQLLKIMKTEPLKWQVVVNLLVETGMRIGECMGLQWDDIDWKNNAIRIRASLSYTAKKGIFLTTPKNRRIRTVYVSDEMMGLLLSQYIDNARGANSPFVSHQDGSTAPMHPQSPGKYLKRLTKKHGIPHIHPHKLRHSYASIAITNGADVTSVADNLGHRDSSITLRVYSNANEKSKRNASNICLNAVKQALQSA